MHAPSLTPHTVSRVLRVPPLRQRQLTRSPCRPVPPKRVPSSHATASVQPAPPPTTSSGVTLIRPYHYMQFLHATQAIPLACNRNSSTRPAWPRLYRNSCSSCRTQCDSGQHSCSSLPATATARRVCCLTFPLPCRHSRLGPRNPSLTLRLKQRDTGSCTCEMLSRCATANRKTANRKNSA